jgi:hypothetical protein
MKLIEVIGNLESADNSLTICASREPDWSGASEAELRPSNRVNSESKPPYFLDVAVAKDVLRAWSFVRNGRVPTLSEKCEALIYYAENDCYLLPGCERNSNRDDEL